MESIMKIFGTSDLHLDGNRLPRVESPGRPVVERLVDFANHQDDILLLAGDTCEVRSLRPSQIHIGEVDDNGIQKDVRVASKTLRDLEDICKAFKFVYAVMGNHEFYSNVFDDTLEEYRDLTKHIPNFRVLENEVVEVEGVKIIASTLWTDFNGYDFHTMMTAKQNMNDYHVIQKSRVFDDQPQRLQPEEIGKVHFASRQFVFDELKKIGEDEIVVVMTHHAPIVAHANPQRYGSNVLDYAYACTDMEKTLLDHDKDVAIWFHGHTHDWKLSNVGDTIVATFARGYDDKSFKPQMLIDTLVDPVERENIPLDRRAETFKGSEKQYSKMGGDYF